MRTVVVGLLGLGAVAAWPGWRARPTAIPGGLARPAGAARMLGWLRRHLRIQTGDEVTASELADTLVLVALAVRSGLGLPEALHHVRDCTTGAVRQDLASVVAALSWGRSGAQAWAFAGSAWRPVALAWQVAERTGAPPADLLEDAADRLREADERRVERGAARAGVLLVLPLGFGFLPAFALTAVVPVVLALAGGVLVG